MQIIPHIYIMLYPILLLLYLLAGNPIKTRSIDILYGINILLCFFAFYQVRKFIGILQFIRTFKGNSYLKMPAISYTSEFVLVQAANVLLPLVLLIPVCRRSMVYSALLFTFFFWYNSFTNLSFSNFSFSLAYCFSLFSATYALLWLLKKLPSQK